MRKSWELYPSTVDLRVQSLDPPSLLSTSSTSFPPGSFLIGNHAYVPPLNEPRLTCTQGTS